MTSNAIDCIKKYTDKFIPRLTPNTELRRPVLVIIDKDEYDALEFSSRAERRKVVNELNGKRLFFLADWEAEKINLETEDEEIKKQYFYNKKLRDYVSVVPNKLV